MKILIAPDSFKECMTAKEACDAIELGAIAVYPDADIVKIPMSDGGEGIMRALVEAVGGSYHTYTVRDPLMRPVEAAIGILADGETAVIEMAQASGLELVAPDERNPLYTTSWGTGELIVRALERGAKRLIIGIGGSATNDCGAGMLMAMGVPLTDADGNLLQCGGAFLNELRELDLSAVRALLDGVEVVVACDVTNPLLGETGATRIFSRQKGATDEMMVELESGLARFAEVAQNVCGAEITQISGGGAAGGLGACLAGLCGARLVKGIELVIEYTKLERHIAKCDIVVTGEGSIDFQTQFGKTPFGVASIARKYNKPVIGFAGVLGNGYEALYEYGFSAMFSISNAEPNLKAALANGKNNLRAAAENVFRCVKSTSYINTSTV